MLTCRARTRVMVVMLAALSGPGTAAALAASAPIAATVHIKNFAFAPTLLTVRAGARIAFINDDDEAHTVTASDKTFDSAGLDTNGRYERVFSVPGTYRYFCALHPYMKASIVVLPASHPADGQ